MTVHIFDTLADKTWTLTKEIINGNDAGYESIVAISTSGSGTTQSTASFHLLNADKHLERYPSQNLYDTFPSVTELASLSVHECSNGKVVKVGSQYFRYDTMSTTVSDGTTAIAPFDLAFPHPPPPHPSKNVTVTGWKATTIAGTVFNGGSTDGQGLRARFAARSPVRGSREGRRSLHPRAPCWD